MRSETHARPDPGSGEIAPVGARPPVHKASTRVLERIQDGIYIVAGGLLVVITVLVLASGAYDFVKNVRLDDMLGSAVTLLNAILLALILAEIIHTVVLSLQTHSLAPEPFIVIGLIAIIRKILFVTTADSEGELDPVNLAVLGALVFVFAGSLVSIHYFRTRWPDQSRR